jgi:hypothetical protein
MLPGGSAASGAESWPSRQDSGATAHQNRQRTTDEYHPDEADQADQLGNMLQGDVAFDSGDLVAHPGRGPKPTGG